MGEWSLLCIQYSFPRTVDNISHRYESLSLSLSLSPLLLYQERIFSNSLRRFFYSHAATQTTQWHPPTASEVRNPAIAKMRVDQNTQDAKKRRRT